MWPTARAMGKKGDGMISEAPAGATEIIDHCERVCRPLTRAEVLTTAASPGLSPWATIYRP